MDMACAALSGGTHVDEARRCAREAAFMHFFRQQPGRTRTHIPAWRNSSTRDLRRRRTAAAPFPADLDLLVALAGYQHDVAGRCFVAWPGQWPCDGSRLHCVFALPVRCSPTTASLMMASGSSLRGLSVVTPPNHCRHPVACPSAAVGAIAVAAAAEDGNHSPLFPAC